MTLLDLWNTGVHEVRESSMVKGVLYLSVTLLAIIVAISVLLLVMFLLRDFVRRHPFLKRAQKTLLYLLTMTGVALLLLAGLLGVLLPLIPGIPFLLLALLLMRRYHKSPLTGHWLQVLRERVRQLTKRKIKKEERVAPERSSSQERR